MSRGTADPRSAAIHLMAELNAKPGDISISTLKRNDDTILRVFLAPGSRFIRKDIPSFWDGYKVLCEVAEPPKAY